MLVKIHTNKNTIFVTIMKTTVWIWVGIIFTEHPHHHNSWLKNRILVHQFCPSICLSQP